MSVIAAIVFVAVFGVVALSILAMGAGASQRQKQVMERLESLTLAARRVPEDEGLNILREEMLSSVPWIDRWLHEIDVFPKLRWILRQADVKWTLTGLLTRSLGRERRSARPFIGAPARGCFRCCSAPRRRASPSCMSFTSAPCGSGALKKSCPRRWT